MIPANPVSYSTFNAFRPMARRAATRVICALGLLVSACSGAVDTQSQLGATDVASPAANQTMGATQPAVQKAPAVLASAGAPPAGAMAASVAPAAVTCPAGQGPSRSQPLRVIDQRCSQLRQEGEVWQRTRKLAILNRGEAGARMADLHSPWTKENITFYVDQCTPRQQRNRDQVLGRLDPRQLASVCR